MSWNEISSQEAFFLFSCQKKKKKKEYYIVVIKSSFFKLYPVLSKAANFIYDGALRLRVCGLRLFLALHQDTGAGWPFRSLVCDLWPHPRSPCVMSAVGCGLESTGTQSVAAFLSFSFFLPPTRKLSCATHPIQSQVYCSFHTQVKQPKGKRTSRAGQEHLDEGGEDSEFPTLLSVFFFIIISNHSACQV